MDPKDLFRQHGGATPEFSLNNMKTTARVVSVYDGDTLTVVLPVFSTFFKFNVRMSGIDTCEIKSKSPKNKELAYRARNRLFQLITGKAIDANGIDSWKRKQVDEFLEADVYLVNIHCLEFDKYGRLLATVYPVTPTDPSIPHISFSDTLLKDRLAYAYQGDTKLTEEDQVRLLAQPITPP